MPAQQHPQTAPAATEADLLITFTPQEGTLIDGTSRGDGTASILKGNGWRWSRHLSAWFVPYTRDKLPKRHIIDATRAQLERAGFTVAVEISEQIVRDQGAAEADQASRSQDRAARMTARAEKHDRQAAAADAAVDRITEHIPFGQPILVGHHSQRRAERDAERIQRGTRRAIDEREAARRDRGAAASAAIATDCRENPYMVARRIDTLAASVRKLERQCPTPGTTQHDYLVRDRAQLAHWQTVRAQQLEDGAVTVYSRDDIKAGDLITQGSRRQDWLRVTRANTTTVTIESYGCTYKVPYHQIHSHHRP